MSALAVTTRRYIMLTEKDSASAANNASRRHVERIVKMKSAGEQESRLIENIIYMTLSVVLMGIAVSVIA